MSARITAEMYAEYHGCSLATARRHLREVSWFYPRAVKVTNEARHDPNRETPRWWKVYEVQLDLLKDALHVVGWRPVTWRVANLVELIEETTQ